MPSYKLLYTITVGGMSGNTTHQDTDVLDLDAPAWGPEAAEEATSLIAAKMKLAKQQRVLSVTFLDVQKQRDGEGSVGSYYLVYTTTLRTLDGPQPRTGAGFFDLHHPTWSPAALEEAIALIESQLPLWEKPQIVETIVTFVKECSA